MADQGEQVAEALAYGDDRTVDEDAEDESQGQPEDEGVGHRVTRYMA